MSLQIPEKLSHVRKLIDQAKFNEALEIIENFENSESLSPEDQLSALLIKARIYTYTREYEKNVEVSSRAYEISQELGRASESVEALIGKAYIIFIDDLDKASTYVTEAERLLKSLPDNFSTEVLRRRLLSIKSWILLFKGNINGATESAQQCLKLIKEDKLSNKLELTATFLVLGWINAYQGNRVKALDYAMKSLKHNKELNHDVAIAADYTLIARIYLGKGDYDQALQYCKQSLAIKGITSRTKLTALQNLAIIYYFKSKLNRALKYQLQVISLGEELNLTDPLVDSLMWVGYIYNILGKSNLALEYFERSLTLSEKWGFTMTIAQSLTNLIWIYIDLNSREKANRYFSRLSELYDRTMDKVDVDISYFYLGTKAYMMKSSPRMRDRVKAQELFREVIDRTPPGSENLMLFMGNLCDLLFEELSLYNNPEILDEIIPLVTRSLGMAETSRNYKWLAESKLLQAKLALIQMNLEEAKKLMVLAQRIADLHGLNLLAYRISGEHDNLLEQIDAWDAVKKEEAPMAERIKLASTNGVLERIQGKSAVESIESVDEQSTVLLILTEGGVLIFSYPFTDEWRIDVDLFSGFLSAFTSFSTEFFSKGLDRVKFGDEMMLMESIGSFSFCYLFKGQTYIAKQKLSKFTEEVQKNTSLWQSLEDHYEASQILELRESPQLELLITEIFMSKS